MQPRRALLLACAAVVAACDPAPIEGAPCTHWEESESLHLGPDELDLLLVVDGSGSSVDAFTDALPSLLEALSSGDVDGDGSPEIDAARSIHVGVITSDLGAGGHAIPGCVGGGDRGELRTAGDPTVAGCAASYPPFHVIERGGRPAGEVAAELGCVAALARGGCPIAQPLEAVLRALSPETTANAGFLRERSALAIVIVSDQDDCSAADPRLFDPDDASLGEPSLRCGLHPELLHPIDRYAAATELRSTTGRLVFASIAGIPSDAIEWPRSTPDYPTLLARPELELRVDPGEPTRLVPSCTGPITGDAYPPRRLAMAGRDLQVLGAGTTVQSICEPSLDRAIEGVAWAVAERVGRPCLIEPLAGVGPGVTSECALTEILPVGDACEDHPGRTHLRTRDLAGARRTECLLRALTREQAIAGEPGWYLETSDDPLPGSDVLELCGEDASRVEIVGGLVPLSDTRLYCPRSIEPDGGVCP